MKPETVGMSLARLVRLDEVMKRRYVDGGYLPGMVPTYIAERSVQPRSQIQSGPPGGGWWS